MWGCNNIKSLNLESLHSKGDLCKSFYKSTDSFKNYTLKNVCSNKNIVFLYCIGVHLLPYFL